MFVAHIFKLSFVPICLGTKLYFSFDGGGGVESAHTFLRGGGQSTYRGSGEGKRPDLSPYPVHESDSKSTKNFNSDVSHNELMINISL